MLPLATSTARITAVCGFPSGEHHSRIEAAEAQAAVQDGADEIDVVIDVGAAMAGDFEAAQRDIAAVRAVRHRGRPAGRHADGVLTGGIRKDTLGSPPAAGTPTHNGRTRR